MPIYAIRGSEHRGGNDEEAELIPQLATMFRDQWRENRAGTWQPCMTVLVHSSPWATGLQAWGGGSIIQSMLLML